MSAQTGEAHGEARAAQAVSGNFGDRGSAHGRELLTEHTAPWGLDQGPQGGLGGPTLESQGRSGPGPWEAGEGRGSGPRRGPELLLRTNSSSQGRRADPGGGGREARALVAPAAWPCLEPGP